MTTGISAAGIIFSLVLLMYLCFRRWPILVLAPLCGVLVTLISGENVLKSLSGPYSTGLANYAKLFFLIFLLGSICGKLMEDTGAAQSIAHTIIKTVGRKGALLAAMSVVLIAAILTYGGVVVFVIVFTIAPIALPLFKETDLPWEILPGLLAFGGATFTMSMLPGSPAIQNIIPTRYLGTDAMAGAALGIIATIVTVVLNVLYYSYVIKKYRQKGMGFAGLGERIYNTRFTDSQIEEKDLPNFWLSLTPLIVIVLALNVFKIDIIYSLSIGIILLFIFFWKRVKDKVGTLATGATNSILPLMNTCAIVGFGTLVAATSGFKLLTDSILAIPGHPIISLAVATNLLVGLSGSASGGLGIAMEVLAKPYLALGLTPEVIHRIAAIASAGMDTLPHNGYVISTLTVAGMTHKEGYVHMFVSSVLITLIALVVTLIIGVATL